MALEACIAATSFQAATHKQYNDLVGSCSDYIRDLVIMLYETGARYGELASLNHDNVKLDQRTIKFVDTKKVGENAPSAS